MSGKIELSNEHLAQLDAGNMLQVDVLHMKDYLRNIMGYEDIYSIKVLIQKENGFYNYKLNIEMYTQHPLAQQKVFLKYQIKKFKSFWFGKIKSDDKWRKQEGNVPTIHVLRSLYNEIKLVLPKRHQEDMFIDE